jgi:hypothetical protein
MLRHRMSVERDWNPWDEVFCSVEEDRRVFARTDKGPNGPVKVTRLVKGKDGKRQHPTSRVLDAGIRSIRHGRPSELFLLRLLLIAEVAPTRDELQLLSREFLKAGVEHIRAGSPSELFVKYLEHLSEIAPRCDVLHLCFPREFNPVLMRTIEGEDRAERIANKFREVLAAQVQKGEDRLVSFAETKDEFKARTAFREKVDSRTVDRALAEFNLGVPARGRSKKSAQASPPHQTVQDSARSEYNGGEVTSKARSKRN